MTVIGQLAGEETVSGRVPWRIRLEKASAALVSAGQAAFSAGSKALDRIWPTSRAAPAVASMVLASAGMSMRFGAWAGLLVAAGFCWRIDSRL